MVLTSGLGICSPYKSILPKLCNNSKSVLFSSKDGINISSINTSSENEICYSIELRNECAFFTREVLEYKFGTYLFNSDVYTVLFTNVNMLVKKVPISDPKEDGLRFYKILEYMLK